MEPTRPISRRTFLKLGGRWLAGLLAAPAAGYGYSRWLEPRWIETTRHTLPYRSLPSAFHGTRIVQFSDVHLDFHFGVRRLALLVERIRGLKPDLVCFTGDLFHKQVRPAASASIRLLSELDAPLGKWAVLGNHDYTAGAGDVERVLTQSGFTLLGNRSATIERGGERLRIAGLDDALEGRPNLETALREAADGSPAPFTLFLAHEPDISDYAAAYRVNLQLSGHSHGGQIRLPVVGPLILPDLARRYPEGLYAIRDEMYLYTNRGIGMSSYPYRFLCRPELTVITLASANRPESPG